MKALVIVILGLGSSLISRAQFYAPDTEYHDPVQRVFAVEATRALAWLEGFRNPDGIVEIAYNVTTRSDQSTLWELQCLDSSGKRIRSAKVEYPKQLLESGPAFYRELFSQLWRAKILDQPVAAAKTEDVVAGFWTGAELAGVGREETLGAAFRLISTNFAIADVPDRAGPLAGLLAHAGLASTAGRMTIDNVVLARAAFWLTMAEQCSSTKIDRLWAPILFYSGRDRAGSAIWQKEVAANSPLRTAAENYWNLILRGCSTREAYLFAAEQKNFSHGLSLIAYDILLNDTGQLVEALLPAISRNGGELARAHNYGPLLSLKTSIGGGQILNGAWPILSRTAAVNLLETFPENTADAELFRSTVTKLKQETSALTIKGFSNDASLFGFKEAIPLLLLGHKEGVGKLRPCGIVSARDALNYCWEMGGLQMGARTIFVRRRWGIRDQGEELFKSATAEVQGWMPFFVNSKESPVASYRDSLLRLQMVDGAFQRVGFSENPYAGTLSDADAVRLWVKRGWMRPREFEWQARTMWDANIKQEIPELISALQEGARARGAVEVLSYFRHLSANDFKLLPRGYELRNTLADTLPQPTLLWLNAIYDRDIKKLQPYERGVEIEKRFWRNPDGDLENRVLRGYLAHPAFKAAKQFYLNFRENISDQVAFSNNSGQLLWMAGYITQDKELRKMAIEDSSSGSHSDMLLNIWEHAVNAADKEMASQLDELIERYEGNQGNSSLGRALKRFLPLLPALSNPKHPRRAEALRFFGKAPAWTILRWIWIEKYTIPAADAIVLLGGRENDDLRSLMIAVLEGDQPKALEHINAYNKSRSMVDEYSLLAGHVYSRLHSYRPEPPLKNLKPPGFVFTREAVFQKIGKSP